MDVKTALYWNYKNIWLNAVIEESDAENGGWSLQ